MMGAASNACPGSLALIRKVSTLSPLLRRCKLTLLEKFLELCAASLLLLRSRVQQDLVDTWSSNKATPITNLQIPQ